MKKVLAALLAVLMCVMMIPVSAEAPDTAQVIYTLSGASLKSGETAELTLHLKSLVDANSFAIVLLPIPNGLTLEEVTLTDAANSTFLFKTYDAENMAFTFGAMTPGKYDLDVAKLKIKAGTHETNSNYGLNAKSVISKNSSVKLESYYEIGYIDVQPMPKKDFPSSIKFNDSTVTYDGTEHTVSVTGNLPEGTTVTYQNNTGTDAGTYIARATLDAEGYSTLTLSATLKINPKSLTVSGINAADKTYDKTNTALISGGTLSGAVSGDDVSASVPEKGKFASVNAGKNIAVSIDAITLEGKDADNYTLSNSEYKGLKATINQAEITVTADSLSKRIGDADAPLTYKITEGALCEGDAITGSLARAKGETAGTYAITKGTLSAGSNYKLTFVPGTYTISDKETQNVTVAGVPEKVTYGDDGFVIEVTYDENANLDETEFASRNENVLSVDQNGNVKIVGAGNAVLTVTVKGDDNYADFVKTFNVTVEKRKITVTADDASKKTGTSDPDEFTYSITEGKLVNGDEFTGKLTRVAGEKAGEYKIQQGSLKLGANYELTFVAGTFTIADKKTQNVVVSGIPEKTTYGSDGFKVNVELDAQSGLGDVEYAIDNTKVADIDTEGNVEIIGAGTANITVTVGGDEEYADFAKTVKLTVAKKDITVTIDNKTKKLGEDDPEFTFTVTGGLVGDDEITGEPKRAAGEKLGTYAIRKGTLDAGANYNVKFIEGKLTITDKTPQDITVDEIGDVTYGDGVFAIVVNYDAVSGLTDTAFKSSNTKVLAVDEDGNVTVKGAGTANITVTVGGDEEYAAFEKVIAVTVAKKAISVDGLDFANGLVESADILDGDEVKYDLSKAKLEFSEDASEVEIKNFAIVEHNNYVLADDQTTITVRANADDFAKVTVIEPSAGEITGDGYYLIGTKATLTATPDKGYRVSGWYKGTTLVSSNATYTFTVTANITLSVRFMKKSSSYTIPGSSTGSNNNNGSSLVKDLPKTKIELTIGDKEAFVDNYSVLNDVAPVISNGRTMLPSRFVAEALGAKVEWDETERKVTITGNEKVIELYIGSRYAYVNGFQKMLETEPFIENDRTFTPIRFISELLGANVDWNETTRTVTITKY